MSGDGVGAGESLPKFAAMVVAVGAVGLLAAAFLPSDPEARKAAFVGVAGSVGSSGLGLLLKRRFLERSVQATLAVVGAVFGVRMVMVALGVVLGTRAGWPVLAMVVGFFSTYLVLQCIEVAYVMAEMKRRGRGGV